MDCTQCGEPLKKDDVLHSTGQCWANLRARADAAEAQVAVLREHMTVDIGNAGGVGTHSECGVISCNGGVTCPWNDTAALATAHDAQVWKAAMERAAVLVAGDYDVEHGLMRRAIEQFRESSIYDYAARVLSRIESKLRALAAAGPGK
jgi:hypothetical protein